MGIARNLAALASRRARSALILLYALHVAFLFREHLFQLYHAALDTVHHTTAQTDFVGSVLEKAKRLFDHKDGRPRISAAHGFPLAILAIVDDHERHDPHHDPGDEKRRERHGRHGRRHHVIDLYRRILRFPPPAGTDRGHAPYGLLRLMRFAA